MNKKKSGSLDCADCKEAEDLHVYTQQEAENRMVFDLPHRAIHIHFRGSTRSNEENIAEAEWVQRSVQEILQKHPDGPVSLLADFTNGDDSEFVPLESMRIYKQVAQQERIALIVVYGATPSMGSIVEGLIRITLRMSHLHLVQTEDQALEKIHDWSAKAID